MFSEDLDQFFADSDDAIFQHGTDTPKPIQVIFDNAYKHVDVGVGVESSGPAATVKSADIIGVVHRDKLTVNSTLYYITGIEPDGTGITLLRLSED